jgi:putative membrane protein
MQNTKGVMKTKQLNIREFIKYKLLNSTFLGLSVGSIFVLYTPLMPSIYSIGGILLALAMLIIAKFYYKILNVNYFFKISLFVELVLLGAILYFLLFSYSYASALIFYIGYQITFSFGSYLIRAETLFLKKTKALELVDVAKQKGYLLGMFLAYIFYKLLEDFFLISDKKIQVYDIHFLLLLLELLIIFYLFKSFRDQK